MTTVKKINQNKKNLIQGPQEKRGFISKKSPSIFKSWQERYFILKDRKLKYFKSMSAEDMSVPKGVINFDNFSCNIQQQSDLTFNLTISGVESRKFEFKSKTKQECSAWMKELTRHFDGS